MASLNEQNLHKALASLSKRINENEEPKQPGSFTHHTEKPKREKKPRFQYAPGPDPKEYGEPENIWNPPGVQPALNKDYMDWSASEQGQAHRAAQTAHFKQQGELFNKHKARHGSFDMELTVPNPYFDVNAEDDDEEPEEIDVGVDYEISGEYMPATWGYNGGNPEEYPDIEIHKVIDLDTGEDITDDVDLEYIEQQIADGNSDRMNMSARDYHRKYREPDDDIEESVAERQLREMSENLKKKLLGEVTALQPGVTVYNGAYLSPDQVKHNIEMLKAGKAKLDPMDHANTWVQDLANGWTFGLADKAAAGLDSVFHGTKYNDELAKYKDSNKAYGELPGAVSYNIPGTDMHVTPGDVASLFGGAGLVGGAWKTGTKLAAKAGIKGWMGGLGATYGAGKAADAIAAPDDKTTGTQQPAQPAPGQKQPAPGQKQPTQQKQPYNTGTADQIKALQKVIGAKIDGIYGPETKQKLMAWQKQQGLKVDGVPGPETYKALIKYVTGKPAEQAAKDMQQTMAGDPSNGNVAETITYGEDESLARIVQLSRR